jgi:hypothetical protein
LTVGQTKVPVLVNYPIFDETKPLK